MAMVMVGSYCNKVTNNLNTSAVGAINFVSNFVHQVLLQNHSKDAHLLDAITNLPTRRSTLKLLVKGFCLIMKYPCLL